VAGVTIQQILQQGYAAFEQCHSLPAYVRKAAWALLACRTARLGGHLHACSAVSPMRLAPGGALAGPAEGAVAGV
jgi:hypothetical protein